MRTSKKAKLRILIFILLILVLVLLGVFLYDKIHATRVTAELTRIVAEFHENENYVEIEGHGVIGTIRIDRLGIEYPIIEYRGAHSLDIAICKYAGPGINELGNVSLLGHNMRNGLFFSNLHRLENGDIIKLTDMSRKDCRVHSK